MWHIPSVTPKISKNTNGPYESPIFRNPLRDCWYGGGIDLTPYFPYPEDFRHFHQTLQQVCERCIPDSYKNTRKTVMSIFHSLTVRR